VAGDLSRHFPDLFIIFSQPFEILKLVEGAILVPEEHLLSRRLIMFYRGIFWRILLAVLLVGLLVLGGGALYRAGWAQGYQAAALAASASGSEGAPVAPYYGVYPQYPAFGYPPFFAPFWAPFGLCLGVGFFFLLLFLIGGLFRPHRWGHWGGGPKHGDWQGGPMPPWVKEWKESQQPGEGEKTEGTASATG
jgi:hypothetical protein